MSNTIIQIKNSSVYGNVPSTLQPGELAINYADGKLYYGNVTNQSTLFDVVTEPSGLNGEIQFNDSGVFGATSDLRYDAANNALVINKLFNTLAVTQSTPLPNAFGVLTGNSSNYVQFAIENIDPNGSSDYIATADVGSDETFFIDLGIQNSGQQLGVFYPLDGYLYVQGNTGQLGGNLIIGTSTTGQKTKIIAGGSEVDNVVAEFSETLFNVSTELSSPTTNRIYLHANAAFDYANTLNTVAIDQTARNTANAAYDAANNVAPQIEPAYAHANAAFDTANNKVSKSGDIITGSLTVSNNVRANNIIANTQFYAGIATELATPLPHLIAQFTGNTDPYIQVNLQNINPDGSADFVITADTGNDDSFYIDLGIQNSNRTDGQLYPLDGYLIAKGNTGQLGGNLVIGSTSETPGIKTKFISGTVDNVVAEVDADSFIFFNEIDSPTTNRIYLHANAAFDSANNVAPQVQPAFNKANAAFDRANLSQQYAQSAGDYANSSFERANTVNTYFYGVSDSINVSVITAGTYANSAYESQNSTANYANSAYSLANTKFSSSGGSITGYANVSSNVSVGSYIDFKTTSNPTQSEGRVFYDNTQHALSYNNDGGVTLQIGQEEIVRVWNNTGSEISEGSAVYFKPESSANNFPGVGLAVATSAETAAVIGVTTTVIPVDGYGYVTQRGRVNNLNTSLLTVGGALYLSSSIPGSFSTTVPSTPNVAFYIGRVVSSDVSSGIIQVYPQADYPRNFANGSIFIAQNGLITQDQAHFFYDVANNRLGLGTNQPTANLHVAGDGLFTGNVTISGNLLVSNAQAITTTELTVGGNVIILNSEVTGSPSSNAEIIINRGTSSNAILRWDESIDEWTIDEGDGINGHILHHRKIATTWSEYSAQLSYQKLRYPVGGTLSNTINETATAGFIVANTAQNHSVSAFLHANSSFDRANSSVLNTSDSMSGTLYVQTISANNTIKTNSIADIQSTSITTSSVSQVTLHSWSTSTYRSGKYYVQITSGSSYHVIELSILHDGTTAYLVQYGEIVTDTSLGTFDASISGGTLSVLFTPVNSSTTVKTFHTLIPV